MLNPQKHIIDRLNYFIGDEEYSFSAVYHFLERKDKAEFKPLLVYVDKILEQGLKNSKIQPAYFHLHFEGIPEHSILYILEFVILRSFFQHYLRVPSSSDSDFLSKKIQYLKSLLSRPLNPGQDVSAKSREFRKIQEKRKNLRKLCGFYEKLKEIKDGDCEIFKPKVLLNVLKQDQNSIQEVFRYRPFAVTIKEFFLSKEFNNSSFVILNSEKDRDGLDGLEVSKDYDLIGEIEDVIIFNCEGRSIHKSFNFSILEELNREGENFKSLIVFSFSNDSQLRLNRLISRLDRIETSYYYRPKGLRFSSYVVLPDELNHLVDRTTYSKANIKFIETDNTFCQVFQEQLNEHEELYELYSIKLRNLYSICFDPEIKKIILEEIFLPDIKSPNLISEDTKRYLLQLDNEYREELRTTLENILNLVIDQNLSNVIRRNGYAPPYCVVIPATILKHKNLTSLVKKALAPSKEVTVTTWGNLPGIIKSQLIILDYRDTGPFPFQIFPNIHELNIDQSKQAIGIFLSMFFKYNYEYTNYEYNKVLINRVLDHPLRKKFFKWNNLTTEIKNLKPKKHDFDHLWDIENSYDYSNREVVIIKYSKGERSFVPSQLFIVSGGRNSKLHTDRAANLINELEYADTLKVQPIEELYVDLNLFETTKREETELLSMKKNYGLKEDELEQRLWKTLLERETRNKGIDQVYSDLNKRIHQIGAKIVSRNYFEKFWLEPQSDSLIPRSKKVFRVLCEYLDLPRVYYVVMLKKRAKERLASKKSTFKMNRLIADLIHEGFFDSSYNEGKKYSFEDFTKNHDLEEVGITEENYKEELTSLVELLKPYLNLRKVKKIESKQL